MRVYNIAKNIFLNPKSFLLDNKTVKQTIFKNTFWLAVAEGISRLLKLILIIYVARILGATEYGKFTFALAFVSLFVIFSDFGLSHITVRELSREKKKEKEFSSIFTLKILLSTGALILMTVGSLFITPDQDIQKVIWILAVYILIYSFSEIIYAFLRARQQMQYEAWAKILQAIVVTGAGFYIILNFPSVQNLSFGYLFASSIVLIFILLFFHFKIYHFSLGWDKTIWRKFLAMSWPIGFVAIFATIYNQIDSVMMGYWGQITQTGWYNAAYRIVNVTIVPAVLISQCFYPVLSIAFKESKEKLQNIWNYQMELMITLAVPLMIGGIALAPGIIDFIYGPSFSPSVLAFQILIIMAGIVFFIYAFSQILIVSNQQKKNFWITFTGAVVNIVLNLILIPKYSLYGAAISTLITMLLIFILYLIATAKFTSVRPLNLKIFLVFLGAIFSSVPMYFAISWPLTYNLNVILTVLIGAGVYLICLFMLNKIFRLNRIKP